MNKAYILILLMFLCENNISCCNKFLYYNKEEKEELELFLLKKSLFDAIMLGKLEKVKSIIEKNKQEDLENTLFNSCNYSRNYSKLTGNRYTNRFMPIHVAALAGKLDIFRYFVEERKIDINIENSDTLESSVFIAASNGKFNIVEYCLSKGQDINAKNNSKYGSYKKTLLTHAVEKFFPAYCLIYFGAIISEDNLDVAKKIEDKKFYEYMTIAREFDLKRTVKDKVDYAKDSLNLILKNIELERVNNSQIKPVIGFKKLFDTFLFRIEKSGLSKDSKGEFLKDIYKYKRDLEFRSNLLNAIRKKDRDSSCKELLNKACSRNFCDVNISFS